MQLNTPEGVLVPTLDIDLAWHTHQLSPQHYFHFTVAKTGAFTDHNDKIDEDKVGISFDWMSKTYQEKYGEVYSECICWFYEALRYKHTISSRRIPFLGRKGRPVTECDSEASKASWPPIQESAHISSHPAVHAVQETNMYRRRQRQQFAGDLDEAYSKLLKEANKSLKKRSTSESEKPSIGATRTRLLQLLR
ncbi:hypothetical protein DL546_006872 [Coniochaeta pulveracea]|uniref:Uncharacterized protein n=1 Tax=Coniochaeta pulveracea TaxID=177199 RepID=A0A420YI68_9PEZI|nr:hypothetical protein DL546_006872 [Coniochaeta pulveracea]